ncbi:hypothetical protein ACSBR2_017223 [Camellia fascicularis]
MGNNSPKPFYNDVYMISTLKTAQNDIFVTFGTGNMGLTPSTIVNSAPWVTTVGSNTIDRTYPAKDFLQGGPNTIVLEILTPDLLALGEAIMASWTNVMPPTMIENDIRHVEYNFVSSTSVSCAIVASFAALMRNIHSDRFLATIRSTMMTTSTSLDHNNRPISSSNFQQLGTQLDFDIGHISPQLATDPGLIFDIDGMDYIDFLCTLNYPTSQLYKIVGEQVICEEPAFHQVSRLNYPSFSTIFNKLRRAARLWSTMTHVAESRETYTLTVVNSNSDIMIYVAPKQLQFTRVGEKKSYSIEMSFFYSNGPNRLDVHVPMEVLAIGYVI